MSGARLSTHYRTACDAVEKLADDPEFIAYQRLEELKLLRDLVEDKIWDIKLATGIGLWRKPEDE